MCHLLLLMPAIALPIFWLAPLNVAIPIYAVIVLISGLLYWLIVSSMRKIPEIGAESLPGTEAEVIAKIGPGQRAQYLVRSQGELWSARSADTLQAGETVQIAAVDGISLIVERRNNSYQSDGASSAGRGRVGARANERRCH